MKTQTNNNSVERRYLAFEGSKVEYRGDEGDKKPYIVGYASVFNSLSEDLGGFRELVHKDSFNDVLQDDVRALFNHDPNLILGRSTAGTLKLDVDETGLKYELQVPDTTAGRDLLVSIERGDVSQSSFGFRVDSDHFDQDAEGEWVRTITRVRSLLDISPVVYPAYQDTSTSTARRSLDAIIESRKNEEEATDADSLLDYNRKLKLVKIKNTNT